jgi:hypothetical protein
LIEPIHVAEYLILITNRHHGEEKITMVWPLQKDARGENTKTIYGMDTTGEMEKKTPKENVDGRTSSSHDNKKFRSRTMEKQRGVASVSRKTATAVKNDGWTDGMTNGRTE